MEEHKVIIVVVILGMTAIVMMGMVAKIALLETQVANAPRMHDNLRRQQAPRPKTKPPAGGTAPAAPGQAGDGDTASSTPSAYGAQPKASPFGTPRSSSQTSSAPDAAISPAAAEDAEERLAQAEESIVRLTVVDHKEEKSGIALAIGEGGVLLVSAPLLAGAYEGWCTVPKSRRKSPTFKLCIAHSPETRMALVRVDEHNAPLSALPLASAPTSKGDRLRAFYETGQLDVGRVEAKVEALLSAGDVEKKLQLPAPDTGDAVWLELLGSFPQNMFGSPVINQAGELAGVILLDSQGTAAAKAPAGGLARGFAAATSSGTMRRVYAVSVEALSPLLEQSSSPADQILFTLNVAPLQKPRAAAATSWLVKLASGETIDDKTFAVTTLRGGAGTLNYSGAGKCATLALSERKNIDGALMVYTSEGKELLRVGMDQGRREGALVVSSAEGECVLAAHFQRGVRHGYGAWFKNGAPWLIEIHREGSLDSQHLVKEGAVFYSAPAGSAPETLTKVLAQYGEWSQWEARLSEVEAAIQRWAKEADRHQRAGRTRLNPDQLHAFQREAVGAVEEFRRLAEQSGEARASTTEAE